MPLLFVLLGALFIGLKLAAIITWSWGLVLLPLYAPIVIATLIALIGFLGLKAVGNI